MPGGGGTGEPPLEPPIGPYQQPEPDEPTQSLQPWIENDIRTPQSSNVYSFAFVPDSSKRKGTLYITYKANELHAEGVAVERGHRGKGQGSHQFKGQHGHTVGKKTNNPGPVYAYLDVPTTVYNGMMRAQSKGKFVWDKLRVRGTIHGHQYRYQLVQGSLIDQSDGRGGRLHGIYVPRRATRKGFRVRSEAAIGTGRRGFVRSALGNQEGFSTRRR